MRSTFFILIFLVAGLGALTAQELNITFRANSQKLTTIDPAIFKSLEQSVADFLSNTKWTDDVYETEERINCNFIMTLQEASGSTYIVDLSVQASRPVYNSVYETSIFNHLDKGLKFNYEINQPVIFSRNNFNDNLSSTLAFYVYMILGMDGDSFAPFGGEQYFQMAQEIVNVVPAAAAELYPGWSVNSSKNNNRYWMIENILSPRVRAYRQAMYDYHRQSLDIMADNVVDGRAIMVAALESVRDVNQAYPNSLIIQMFVNAKNQEVIEIFKQGTLQEQNSVIQIMTRIDPANASRYRAIR